VLSRETTIGLQQKSPPDYHFFFPQGFFDFFLKIYNF